MAAYAATVTSPLRHAVKVDNLDGVGLYFGRVDVTNYNQTVAEISDITGKFKNDPTVVLDPISSEGYGVRWNPTSKSIEAFYGVAASDQTPTADIDAGPFTEVATDVDVGEVNFVAYGII